MPHPVAIARVACREQHAVQKESELASFIALVMDLEPQVIVEIGSDAGGTLWAWQQICPRVIGVDMPYGAFGSGVRLNGHGCEIVSGDSHASETVAVLTDLLDGDVVDVLFVDGDHTFDGVKADFEMYGPLVRPGGIVGFHDICKHPRMPFVEVDRFWASLDGDKESIVTDPPLWGGIGVLRVPALVEVGA